MGFQDFIARQLRKPTGFFGKHVAARWMTRANSEMNRCTLQALSVQSDDHVLEVGPGPGDLLDQIVRLSTRGSTAGVDFSPEMVQTCTRRFGSLIESGRVELQCSSAAAMPFAAERFTKACTVNTIYFWPEPAVELGEIRRVLRPGGRAVVSFRTRATIEKMTNSAVFRLYSGEEAADLLRCAGYVNIAVTEGRDSNGQFVCVSGTKPHH